MARYLKCPTCSKRLRRNEVMYHSIGNQYGEGLKLEYMLCRHCGEQIEIRYANNRIYELEAKLKVLRNIITKEPTPQLVARYKALKSQYEQSLFELNLRGR